MILGNHRLMQVPIPADPIWDVLEDEVKCTIIASHPLRQCFYSGL